MTILKTINPKAKLFGCHSHSKDHLGNAAVKYANDIEKKIAMKFNIDVLDQNRLLMPILEDVPDHHCGISRACWNSVQVLLNMVCE
jgi:hypothetical protein